MLAKDRNALICDMAETYGIFDLRAVPTATLAILAVGLRDDARIKKKLADEKVDQGILLMAAAVDRLSLLVWMQTEDGRKGRNRPTSILEAINGKDKSDREMVAYNSPEEFEAARARILGR